MAEVRKETTQKIRLIRLSRIGGEAYLPEQITVYKSGTFEKTPDFVHHTQSLKCLWIGDSNKLLDAKRPIIGGRLCITPYKRGVINAPPQLLNAWSLHQVIWHLFQRHSHFAHLVVTALFPALQVLDGVDNVDKSSIGVCPHHRGNSSCQLGSQHPPR